MSPGPHRRYNPLLDEWVLCSPQRLDRPWQGQVEPMAAAPAPAWDPACYLCPGNARAGGVRNPAYDGTFVFDNDFPALLPATQDTGSGSDPLLVSEPETGVCRVVCYSPRHDASLASLDDAARRGIVDCWADETERLAARPDVGHVQVFENRGVAMGCSNPHPHGQIWATRHVPSLAARRVAGQRAYYERHGRSLLADYVERELKEQERLVCATDAWAAVVPFWAVWPFEILLLPTRGVERLSALDDVARDGLARILGELHRRFDGLFATPFPYSMAWHQPPSGAPDPALRLHASYFPPLLRSATIRKFLVGYEMAGEAQRDLTPESAAARLRAVVVAP